MWDAINPHTGKRRIDEAFPPEIRFGYDTQAMKFNFGSASNPSTFQLIGSDNFNSLVGSPPVGLVFSEYALSNPAAWGYLRPILLENGGWAGFNSTPRGANHFKSLCKLAQETDGWFYEQLTVDDTGIFTREQLESELREMKAEHGDAYGYALYMQEYYVSFDAAIPGSIWGEAIMRAEREGRIVDFDVDPKRPVYTAWDLGRTDDTSIWWYQFNGPFVDVFDHFSKPFMDICNEEEPEKSLVHVLLERAKMHRFSHYTRHHLPHDARPRTQAAGGKSIFQQFIDAADKYPKLGKFKFVPRLDKQEGIAAGRTTIHRARFHKTQCEQGINALKEYHREWDDENKIFLDNPKHNWASHPADAWRYLSLSWKIPKDAPPDSDNLISLGTEHSITSQSFGKLKERHFRRKKAERSKLF